MAGSKCKHGIVSSPAGLCADCHRELYREGGFRPYASPAGRQARGVAFKKGVDDSWRCIDVTRYANIVERAAAEIVFTEWGETTAERLCDWIAGVARCTGAVLPGVPLLGSRSRKPNCWNCHRPRTSDLPNCWYCRFAICICGNCLCDFRGGWVEPRRRERQLMPPLMRMRSPILERALLVRFFMRVKTELDKRGEYWDLVYERCPWWPRSISTEEV